MAKKKYTASGWNENLNLIVYFCVILAGIGVTWLALNGVPSGIRYSTILSVPVIFLFITFFFIKEEQKDMVKKLIKNPFTTDFQLGAGLFLLGWLLPVIVSLLLALAKLPFNISQLMVPLYTERVVTDIAQSFSVAEAQASPFWQWFIAVFTAGSIEEFAFGFVLMLVGVVIAMLLWKAVTDANPASNGARWFYTIFALLFTVGLFMGVHQLNASYIGVMFIIAGIFRLVMNYSIYVLGFFLSFTLGYHQGNNAVWFWNAYGPSATVSALASPGGIIIILFFVAIFYYVFRNIDQVGPKIKDILTLQEKGL